MKTDPRSAPGGADPHFLGGHPERGAQDRFDDPRLEARRILGELVGTFFLVLVAAGAPVVDATFPGSIPVAVQVTAPGLMVMALILGMGSVSGAHLNPAISLAFAIRGDFPWRRVPGYVVAQLLGAAAAATFLRLTLGHVESGLTTPGTGITESVALAFEAILTVGLVGTVIASASGARNTGGLSAVAVGAYIVLAGLWSAPISGASMNPARSLGPVIVSGRWSGWWIYVLGPFIGAVVGVAIVRGLRGPGGETHEREAAQGEP